MKQSIEQMEQCSISSLNFVYYILIQYSHKLGNSMIMIKFLRNGQNRVNETENSNQKILKFTKKAIIKTLLSLHIVYIFSVFFFFFK